MQDAKRAGPRMPGDQGRHGYAAGGSWRLLRQGSKLSHVVNAQGPPRLRQQFGRALLVVRGAPVLMVEADPARVEQALAAGGLGRAAGGCAAVVAASSVFARGGPAAAPAGRPMCCCRWGCCCAAGTWRA